MSPGLHHALLGLATAALLCAAHRLAATLTERLLERAIATFVMAAAAAVAEALLLGLVGAGSEPLVLTAAAVLTLGAAVALIPPPRPGSGTLLRERWAMLGGGERAAIGAAAGAAALLVVWPLRYPVIGFDGAVYHLPEIVGWVHSGRPAAIEPVSYLFPFANYPITNEVALTWAMGISRSFVPLVLWTQVLFVVTAVTGVLALEALRVPRAVRVLAVAAVLSTPVVIRELATPSTDLAGLCWLVCTAALAAGVRRRPLLLAPTLTAAGLAVGTKTTVAPLLLALLAAAAWSVRDRWRAVARPAIAGLAVGIGVGGVWYVRNALTHGSPLWPFRSLPGGDPVPHVWRLIEPSLLSRPHATVASRVGDYLDALAGALILFVGGALGWLAVRTRAAVFASAAAAGSLLIWAAAPSTGQPHTPVFNSNVVGTTRYAMPAIAAAGASMALAAAGRGRLARVAVALMVAALAWSLVRDVQLGHEFLPYLWAVGAAALLGALLVSAGPPRLHVPPWLAGPAALLVFVAVVAALAIPARDMTRRQIATAPQVPGTPLISWARTQPGFGGSRPVYFAGGAAGQLAGDRLQHRLALISPDESCAVARSRAVKGVVVVETGPVFRQLGVRTPAGCMAGLHATFETLGLRVYGSFQRSRIAPKP